MRQTCQKSRLPSVSLDNMCPQSEYGLIQTTECIINPRRACAARITVVVCVITEHLSLASLTLTRSVAEIHCFPEA